MFASRCGEHDSLSLHSYSRTREKVRFVPFLSSSDSNFKTLKDHYITDNGENYN
jgi:hypothetical protein